MSNNRPQPNHILLKDLIEKNNFTDALQLPINIDETLCQSFYASTLDKGYKFLEFVSFARKHAVNIEMDTVSHLISQLIASGVPSVLDKVSYYLLATDKNTLDKVIASLAKARDLLDKPRNENFFQNVTKLIKLYSERRRIKLLRTFLPCLLEQGNVLGILSIKESVSDNEFAQLISTFNEEQQALMKNILAKSDAREIRDISQVMYEFTNGFGNLTYQGALIASAQIKERKHQYNFNPTVLANIDEFAQFVYTLKMAELPIRERFLLVNEPDWLVGDIHIDTDGIVSMAIIDSLGISHISPKEVFIIFSQAFPNAVIHLSDEHRKSKKDGRSAFAVNNLVHLFSVENYLDKSINKHGLFSYLEKQPALYLTVVKGQDVAKVRACQIPATFGRTLKADKLVKLGKDIFAYLLKTPINEINNKLYSLTLDGFRDRVKVKLKLGYHP